MVPASATAARALMSWRPRGRGARWPGRAACRAAGRPVPPVLRPGGGQPASACRQAVTPLPVSTPSRAGTPRRARAGRHDAVARSGRPARRRGTVLAGMRLVPGSAAAWPGDGSRDRDGSSSFLAGAGRSAAFGVALPAAGQRSLDRAGVHAHAEGLLDRSGSWAGRRPGPAELLLGPGEDFLGELAGPARPGPRGHKPVQPGGLQCGGRGVVRGAGVAERRGGLGDRGAQALTLRTISYLTCTASRASKKSLAPNSGSVTCSGCGFRQRAPASAASLGSGLVSRLAMPLLIIIAVRKILPDMDIVRALMSQRVASFFRNFQARMPTGSRLVLTRAVLCGIILLTLTA